MFFPQAPENNFRVISKVFENSRRYSQVKVHHRYQQHPAANLTPYRLWQIAIGINDIGGKQWEGTLSDCWHFQGTVSPAAILPPVSTTMAANFATSSAGVVDTGGKFATGVNDTGSKFATGVNDAGGKQWEQYQTADNLKWTWRKKFIYKLALLPKGVQKNNDNFSDQRFFPFATGVNNTDGAPWAGNISKVFRKNSKRP
jgi:hypothetical protein